VTDSATDSPQSVPLTGTGVAALTISPTTLTYSLLNLGSSTTMQATVTNASTAAIGVTNLAFSGADPGDFSQTNNCGAKIPGNGSCTITVTFKPVAVGIRSAALMITDSDPSSPQTINVSGTAGTPAISFNPLSLTFASQALNMPSQPLIVTVTNTGTGLLQILTVVINGANKADFSETNTCSTIVNPGGNCTISVTFTPSALGTRTASLGITDDVPGSPQTIPMTGTGSALDFSPSGFDFKGVDVGTSSKLVITVQNVTTSAVTFQNHSFIGANPGDFSESTTCGTQLAGNSTCTITVTFTPQATGARSAQFKMQDSDPSSPQLISLQGTGQ
jgi:hypothetical protein